MRTQPKRSIAEIAKSRILPGVIDRGNPDGQVPRDKWRWVEAARAAKRSEFMAKESGLLLSAEAYGGAKAVYR